MCFFLNHYQVAGVSNLLKTDLEKGINGDDADLLRRRNAFGSNNYPRKKGRSFFVSSTVLGLLKSFDVYQLIRQVDWPAHYKNSIVDITNLFLNNNVNMPIFMGC